MSGHRVDTRTRPPVALRPFHPDDIRLAEEALRARHKLGPPFDFTMAAIEALTASGCVSSRAMANALKKGGKVAEDVSPQSAP